MAHFAKLDSENIVTEVVEVADPAGPDEATGVALLKSLHGADTTWKLTDREAHAGSGFRANYAAVGGKYREAEDVFTGVPAEYPSWTLNTTSWQYECPVPRPEDGNDHVWNEGAQTWDVV